MRGVHRYSQHWQSLATFKKKVHVCISRGWSSPIPHRTRDDPEKEVGQVHLMDRVHRSYLNEYLFVIKNPSGLCFAGTLCNDSLCYCISVCATNRPSQLIHKPLLQECHAMPCHPSHLDLAPSPEIPSTNESSPPLPSPPPTISRLHFIFAFPLVGAGSTACPEIPFSPGWFVPGSTPVFVAPESDATGASPGALPGVWPGAFSAPRPLPKWNSE